MQGLQGLRIALLIDFDNVILGVEDPPGFDVELVVNALRSRGVVVMGRAYGDWYRHSRHRRKLMEQGVELVETPAFGPLIKNSADIRIVLDAFEIAMLQTHIEAFCLVSGDSDFLPLIKKLQYLGKQVIVIAGNKFTSDLVRRNCNEYVSYENLLAESVGAMEDASVLEGAFHLLQRAIHTLHDRGMEVRSSTVKQMMLQLNPAFSERSFGCNQFKQFLDKACRASVVKLGERDRVSGEYLVILAADEVDEAPAPVIEAAAAPASAPASNGAARGDRRPRRPARGPHTEPAPAEAVLTESTLAEASPPTTETGSTPAEIEAPVSATTEEEVPSIPLSARPNLRRGRLRFSGRSFRGGQTANGEPAEAAAPPAAETGSAQESETVAEEATLPLPGITGSEAMGLDAMDVAASDTDAAVSDELPGLAAQAPALEEIAAPVEDAPAEETPAKRTRSTRGGRRRKPAATETGSTPEADAPVADAAATAPESASIPDAVHPEVVPLTEPLADNNASAAELEAAADEAAPEAAKKPARRRRSPRKPAA